MLRFGFMGASLCTRQALWLQLASDSYNANVDDGGVRTRLRHHHRRRINTGSAIIMVSWSEHELGLTTTGGPLRPRLSCQVTTRTPINVYYHSTYGRYSATSQADTLLLYGLHAVAPVGEKVPA